MEPPNQSYLDGMSGVGQLLLENERTKQKLRKVQQRRDFYAKQYFQTLQQLDHVRAELARAMNTIKELRGRDQSAVAANPPSHQSAHSNTTTPDSGTSLSPGIDVMDGRGQDGHSQVEGRDQREGPSSFFWSYDASRPLPSYRPQPAHANLPDKVHNPPPRHLEHQLPRHLERQPHSEHLHRHAFLHHHHHHTPPMQHRTPPLHQRKLTAPTSVSIKEDGYPPHQSAFSPTRPHFPVSPLQRRPPVNPPSALSAHTLPQHAPSGKPAFQRAATLPHFFPPQMLKMYSSGTSDDDEEDVKDIKDGSSDSENSSSKVSAFSALAKNSVPSSVLEQLTTRSATSLTSGSNMADQSKISANDGPSPQLNRDVSHDHTHRVYEQLSNSQLMSVCADIGDPNCSIQKLEIKNSRLGEVQLMALFCTNLSPNHSIIELSLPENGIGKEALNLLLDTIQAKPGLKELKLRSNRIGQDCAALIKSFLTHTTLDSLVMTGNEIEQYGHLMDGQLPKEFSMEYSTDGSEDSGVLTTPADSATSEPSPQSQQQVTNSIKYLRI